MWRCGRAGVAGAAKQGESEAVSVVSKVHGA